MNDTSLFKFRLYIAGRTPTSAEARTNLGAFCRRHLSGRYKIEVVDVAQNPIRALTDGICMTPSLLKLAPSPVCMIVGTLSQSDSLMRALGILDDSLVEV